MRPRPTVHNGKRVSGEARVPVPKFQLIHRGEALTITPMKLAKWFLILVAALSLTAAAQPSQKKAPDKSTRQSTTAVVKQLDINTASEADLKKLPGIGDVYAAKIFNNRPYKRKDELVQKKIIPQATYDKIKDQIIAKQTGGK